jgi:DNA repair exonuclease SbcCD ATPase subunit
MLDRFDKELQEIKEQVKYKRKWEDQLGRLQDEAEQQEVKLNMLKSMRNKEQRDVDRMESFSVPAILYSLIGRKLEKIDKEKREAITAELRYQEACRTAEDMKRELAELQNQLASVQNADRDYAEWMREKERLIHDSQSPLGKELYALMDQEADLRANLKEYGEAFTAGAQARDALERALKSLDSAEGWSNWDMVGGGFISTAIKHEKMDDAHGDIHEAQQALRQFQNELSDITDTALTDLENDQLLTFADYFFDNIVTDWMVHSKIQNSENQTRKILQQTNELLGKLDEEITELKLKRDTVAQKRVALIESGR